MATIQEIFTQNNETTPAQDVSFKAMPFWQKIFDVLQRPNYASAGAAKGIIEGENPFKEAWKGITGRERETYSDVLTSLGWSDEDNIHLSDVAPFLFSDTGKGLPLKKNGIFDVGAKGTIGLAGDIALDPLSYIGLGAFSKGAKGINISKKAIPELAELLARKSTSAQIIAELGTKAIGKNASQLAMELGEKFSKMGVADDIAKELSKNVVRRNTVTFFGHRVLPEAIDEPIVEMFGKGLGKLKTTKPYKFLQNVFQVGGENKKLRTIMQSLKDANASDMYAIETYQKTLHKIIKGFSPKQWDEYYKAIDNMVNPSLISDFNVAEAVKKTIGINSKIKDILDSSGLYKDFFGDMPWNPFHQPKVASINGLKALREYNKLHKASASLSKKIGKFKGKRLIHDTFNPASIEELTKDYVFDSSWKDALKESNIIFKEENGKILASPFMQKVINRETLKNLAEGAGVPVRRWTIKESNDVFSNMFNKAKIKHNGKFFYDTPDMYMPARFGQIMNAVRNQQYTDNIIDVFNIGKKEISAIAGKNGFKTRTDSPFFNLSKKNELLDALRILEAKGYNPAVYVKGDDWVKIFKDSGIKGGNLKKLKEMIDDTGAIKSIDDVEKLISEFPGLSTNIRAHIMDRSAMSEITRQFTKLNSQEEIAAMTKLYKNIYGWWKGMAVMSPGFHFRNMIGNITLNYLGGVYSPKWYKNALSLQIKAHKGTLKGIEKTIWRDIVNHGVKGRVFGRGLMEQSIADILEEPNTFSKIFNVLDRRWIGQKWNREIGSWIEENARIAHYLAKRANGFGVKEAAQSVHKYLFDYTNLTETEQKVFKNILPFYSWLRFNLPLQLENIIKHPGKQAIWGKLIRSIQGDPELPTFLPDWMKEQGAVKIGNTAEGQPLYFPIMNYLPIADIIKLQPKEFGQTLLSQANPLIKTPMEGLSGYSFFRKKPTEAFKGEPEKLMGFLNVRKNTGNMLRVIRGINEIDRLFGEGAKGLSVNERLMRLITGMRLYPQDEQKQIKFFVNGIRKEIRTIKSRIKFAHPQKQQILRDKLREIQQEMRNKFNEYYRKGK